MQFKNEIEIGLKRIVNNSILKEELFDLVKNKTKQLKKSIAAKAIIDDESKLDFDTDKIRRLLDETEPFSMGGVEEAIVLRIGRPVLEIQNDRIDINEPELDYWKDKLKPHQEKLIKPIQSVGRIEIQGHPSLDWVGTGWVVADDIIITNRHVADIFAHKRGNKFVFNQDFFGRNYEVKIDFKEEIEGAVEAVFNITEVIHIEPDSGYDMAFLRIKWQNNNQARPPLPLAEVVQPDKTVAVIGYPARDSRTNIPEDQIRIFGGIFDVKRFAPGEIDAVDTQRGLLLHDCTTLGGCSGSPVVDIETQNVLGLHFAGRERESNFAVIVNMISKKLDAIARPAPTLHLDTSRINDSDLHEERIQISDMEGRNGYDEAFLRKRVLFPKLSFQLASELAPVAERNDGVLTYTNYSVMMDKERRLAIVAAVNIDGKLWRHVHRGRDKWYLDPRIAEEHQVGNDLYRHNDLDRGHLVRRLDPAWGNTLDDAKNAAIDTFFYTNCSPQHKNLNQKIWLGLEEYVLSNADEVDMRVSVFNGPVFGDGDMLYRGIRIPQSYWKVIVTNHPSNQGLHSTAYLLSQGEWLDEIEFLFGEYRTFQLPIFKIEEITGLDFGDLKQYDPLNTDLESVSTVLEIKELDFIVL